MSRQTKIDRIDLNILTALQSDGRMTNQALAAEVGLSASPCLQRVRRLDNCGVIAGYHARLDLSRLCRSVTVLVTASLASHALEDFDRFEAALAGCPEIVECFKVSGAFDYLLRFVCPNIETFAELSDELLNAGPKGLKLSSHVVLAHSKPFQGVHLDRLVE